MKDLPGAMPSSSEHVVLGRIAGVFGLRGWVKVLSYTRPREDILHYSPWLLKVGNEWIARVPRSGHPHGNGLIAQLEACEDRDRAAPLVGATVAVASKQLPALAAGEFYWAQLEGLRVFNRDNIELGRISHLFETGGNDVLVVKPQGRGRERWLPCTRAVVKRVDLDSGIVEVDWDPEF